MPVFQKLVDFDTMFNTLSVPPVVINDFLVASEEEREAIRNQIFTKYSTDMLSVLPSCDCGKTQGEFEIAVKCPHCGTVVKSSILQEVEPIIWFRRPEGVSKLINPIIWTMLNNRFKKGSFEIVRWICDTTYRPSVREPDVLGKLVELNVQRGYNNFIDNFDRNMDILFSLKDFRLKKDKVTKDQPDYLFDLLRGNRDKIFSNYLPLPNKSLLIIEKTNLGIYIDPVIIGAIDAISMIAGIDSPFSESSVRTKENRTVKALSKLSEFYENFYGKIISSKKGILRKHVFGTRSHFSFRAVVSSITRKHEYDEIHVPWMIGVTAFRVHLINKLLKNGFSYNQAVSYLYEHTEKYSLLLDKLLRELIAESPYNGIPAIIQRNPSLALGSAQRVRITRFKEDVNDPTISLSILIVVAPNCDFDGDCMNVSIAIDNYMADLWYNMSPHRNVFVLNSPREVSKNISIPKPVIATMSNWLTSKRGYEEDGVNAEKLARFNQLPEAP